MITENYVSFETAKLLKEKGFDEQCYAYYNIFYDNDGKDLKLWRKYPHRAQPNTNYLNVPTLQTAMKWLREKHNLYVDIILHSVNRTLIYEARIDKINSPSYIDVILPQINEPIYENACESAIKYCLENLI